MRTCRETLSSSNRLFLLRQFLFPAKCRRPLPVPLALLCLVAVLLFCLWPIFLPQPVAKFRQQIGTESASLPGDNASLSALNSSSTELALQLAFGHQVWAQLRSLNCARLFANDVNITRTAKSHRIVQRDPDKLDMECTVVRARWKFLGDADSQEEAQFPLAFARTVYRDYLFLEQMFSVEYAPQNAYCFSLDAKADSKFKRRMRSLASCFPNVWVADTEFSISSNGKNVSRSHLACLEVLRREAKWKYVILLQNHDIPLRTNAEFVRILRVFNGTNDMSTRRVVPISVNTSLDWSVRSLGLYRNESQIPRKLLPDYKLQHTKSLNLVALSRAAVEFSLDQLNLGPLIEQLEKSKYGMDEVLFSTLNSNLPDFPGGFTTECLFRQNHIVQSMGRYTLWRNYGTQTGRCMSNHFRHDLCVYGVEDLPHIQTARLHFYLNKMMPSFDFGAIFCWLNALHTRRSQQAMGKEEPDVNERFYQQLEHVRFNHLRIQNQLDRFKC